MGIIVYNFEEFIDKLYEFRMTSHYLDRSNIDIEKEGNFNKDGSRILPINLTPKRTGFKLIGLKSGNEKIRFEEWLSKYDIDKKNFEFFVSNILNHQTEHKKLEARKKPKNESSYIAYIIYYGMPVIKTQDDEREWELDILVGDEYRGELMIGFALDEDLTTFIVPPVLNKNEYRKMFSEHLKRKRNKLDKWDEEHVMITSILRNINSNIKFYNLMVNNKERIIIDYYDGDEENIEIAKKEIDIAYGGSPNNRYFLLKKKKKGTNDLILEEGLVIKLWNDKLQKKIKIPIMEFDTNIKTIEDREGILISSLISDESIIMIEEVLKKGTKMEIYMDEIKKWIEIEVIDPVYEIKKEKDQEESFIIKYKVSDNEF